ncbi:group II intron maturase-specific domain-containing protein, partial [Nocardia gipuzkoensis]|uniref:group II intron maturase-specific domain-containing protein n=1 Tax=Nocardia gipuzkoensis TaxID=2749991 RepID=UPI00237E85E7
MLRGWCNYFRDGVSSSTFQYLSKIAWRQVMKWLRRKHRRLNRPRFSAAPLWGSRKDMGHAQKDRPSASEPG